MSDRKRRRSAGTYMNRTLRRKIREAVIQRDGNRCCWCKGKMEIPEKGKDVKSYPDMATVEHCFAVAAKEPDNIDLIKLSHERCNK